MKNCYSETIKEPSISPWFTFHCKIEGSFTVSLLWLYHCFIVSLYYNIQSKGFLYLSFLAGDLEKYSMQSVHITFWFVSSLPSTGIEESLGVDFEMASLQIVHCFKIFWWVILSLFEIGRLYAMLSTELTCAMLSFFLPEC